jgi:hypothetical protein
MPVPPSNIVLAAWAMALGLSACATGRPATGSSFDLYYEAVDLFPVAYECVHEAYEKEIERRTDRFRIVKEWLASREPDRTAQRDEELSAREGLMHAPLCASESNDNHKQRARIGAILAELERRVAQTGAR